MSHATPALNPAEPLGNILLTPQQAGEYLGGIAVDTLAVWRSTKRYPLPFIKVGRMVRYRKSDLEAFLAARTQQAA
ncbi:helix-turn-helix domain-containing protein [Methylococcus sp. EFPC2]|uniref:helix-turn-helix domain-containing protein n=1 Tax=Methylococcus sp. EFPC2 TaxID=2812648 RepID=UPI0019680C8C|nr:helix-turn-helix domain-containing protein [Methylococcus sp. EFPC2]QSA98816.1 helix-turn-helix domain-containing protein [Methylococcus sp. EFPC2]